jgi:hypothetical protein
MDYQNYNMDDSIVKLNQKDKGTIQSYLPGSIINTSAENLANAIAPLT